MYTIDVAAVTSKVAISFMDEWSPVVQVHPVAILLAGWQGSGKTTTAEILSNQLDCIHLNVDQVRYRVNQFGLKYYSPELDLSVNKATHAMIRELGRSGRSFVLDANSTPKRITDIKRELASVGAPHQVLTVLLMADPAILTLRVEHRLLRLHQYHAGPEQLESALRQAKPYRPKRYDVPIETSHLSPDEVADRIMVKLNEMIVPVSLAS